MNSVWNALTAIAVALAIVGAGWLVSVPVNRYTDRRRARWLASEAAKNDVAKGQK